jgi:hypothetical protein
MIGLELGKVDTRVMYVSLFEHPSNIIFYSVKPNTTKNQHMCIGVHDLFYLLLAQKLDGKYGEEQVTCFLYTLVV